MSRDSVPYGITFCPLCRCPLQRLADKQGTLQGTLADSLAAHYRIVHPGEKLA